MFNERKTSRSKDENQQQPQPTFDTDSGNQTRATLAGGLRGRQMLNHCAIPAPPKSRRRLKIETLRCSLVPSEKTQQQQQQLL